jgi:hypothetical protein
MTTTLPRPARTEIPPSRGCSICGRRDGWHKERLGGWRCRHCAGLPAPSVDDHGLPGLMRHECSKMGCHLAGEDGDEGDSAIAERAPPAATITVSGPSLLYCPTCRYPVRELLVGTNGRTWCARCPAAADRTGTGPAPRYR